MKTETKSAYQLKKKYEGIQIGLTGVTVNNKNITDEMAVALLEHHAPEKIFEKFPEVAPVMKVVKEEEVKTNRSSLPADVKINGNTKVEDLITFAVANGIIEQPAADAKTDKKALLEKVKAWLDAPIVETPTAPEADTTNQQFATADGFDLATATIEQKADFIDKYKIPFEDRPDGPEYNEEETDAIIKDWLAQDTLG